MATRSNTHDPVGIAQALIRCKSVTPDEGGSLAYLENLLKSAGFEVHRVTFAEPGTPVIENLYARIGKRAPNFAFAGHTDVVPPGDETRWRHGAFSGEVDGGVLYGRGAVDMKGAVACFAAAALDHAAARGGRPRGAISLMITGDEEGPAVNGTVKLAQWAARRGETFDHCIVGEPTSVRRVGDTIKIGRRGSLSGTLTVMGTQGHVAYPEDARNPIPALMAMLKALSEKPFDRGSKEFQPSNLEVTSIDVGNPAFNVIAAEAKARFNLRFNDKHTSASLKKLIGKRLKAAAKGVRYHVDYEPPSESYLTKRGPFVDLVIKATRQAAGVKAALSTSGGTSDARFLRKYCPVVDLGLVGKTMHAIDERAPVEDLRKLTAIYRRILENYFK